MSQIHNIGGSQSLKPRLEEELETKQVALDEKVKEARRSPFSNTAQQDSAEITRLKDTISHLKQRISVLSEMEDTVAQLSRVSFSN